MALNPGSVHKNWWRKYILLFVLCLLYCVTVSAQLTASFGSDKEGGCPPFTIQFSNATSGASSSAVYRWDFGNGNTSDLANPASIYTEEKIYTVSLTVTDGGKTSTYTSQVTGYKKPTADFSVSTTKGCIPAAISFTSNSTPGSGSISRYYWDFGDGITQEDYSNSISHTYMALQKPSVSLTVTNSYGCYNTISKDKVAEILPSIYSSFASDKQILCKPTDAVQFTNTSSGPGTLSYIWDFGDGHTSTTKNPSYSFNKKGIYTVSLTVKNTDGCSITTSQSDYLNVASYKAGFNAQPLVCLGQQTYFTSTSTPIPSSATWFVNDQQVSNGYYDMWYTFPDTGKNTIKLVNIFGTCPDTITAPIYVKPTPQPTGFIADIQSKCGAPSAVKFKDTTAGAVKWNWSFDYNNTQTSALQAPTFSYASDGTYFVNLTITNAAGCSSAIGQYVTITKPFANIYNMLPPDEINWRCGYAKVQMAIGGSSEEIVTYKWNFGDGTTTTDKEPTHEYTSPGNYVVTLEFTTKNGCKGVANSITYTVYKKPKADFTSYPGTTICGNTPVSYVYTGGSATTGFDWRFEGDFNYVSNNQIIQYNSEGVYGVTLIAYNGNCSDTIVKPNYITIKPPFPKITGQTPTCDGTRGLVTFTQASKQATDWKWDFGDSKTQSLSADQPSVQHEYTKTGTYKVVLTTTNGQCNVRDSIYISVLLKQKPALALNPSVVCSNVPITYIASNYEVNPIWTGAYDGYSIERFEYSDGTLLNGLITRNYNTSWNTSATGTIESYQPFDNKIRLITTSAGFGCNDTTNYVPIKFKGASPAFDVIKDKQCYSTGDVILKDVSTAPNNSITSWLWNFGDGQTQSFTTGGQVTHKYENPGSYYVSLTITDAGGCSSSTNAYSKMVEVYGPKAAFYMSTGNNVPLNTTVAFYNSSNNYGVNNPIYEWNFGDGSPVSNAESESHTYTQAGTYIIRLKATNPVTGCTSQTQQTLVVRYFNSAFQFTKSFVTSTQCAPAVASFTNTSYDYTKIIWDFGDGSPLLEDVNYPNHVYKEAGTYEISLLVYGYNGLKGTYKDTITISQPTASLKVSPAEICRGQQAALKASGPGIASYAWDFGDGNVTVSNDSTAQHIYNSTGSFIPQLLITDDQGCTRAAPDDAVIKVRPGPVAKIMPVQPRICAGSNLQLVASGGVSYKWLPADGINQLAIANPVVTPAATATYTVEIKDDLGCTGTGSQTVTVVQREHMQLTPDTGICIGASVRLSVSGTTRYQWIKNITGLDDIQSQTPVAQPLTTTVYTVTGGDEYKCFSDTANVEVKVYDLPSVNAGNDVEVLAGTPVQLQATGSADIVSWAWTPDQHLSCSGCSSPITTTMANTEYKVTVKNIHGCTISDNVIVKMECEANKVYIPSAFTPNNDGLNDFFSIKGIGLVKHLVIFDRLGYKVFEKNNFIASDRSSQWDGTLNGKQLATATFVYFAEMECPSGGPFMRKGTVTLIR